MCVCVWLGWLWYQGSIKDQDLMEKVIREHKIEIVISAVGGASIADQVKLVNAIKAAGTVKVMSKLSSMLLD